MLAGARVGRNCNVCDGAFVENGASVGNPGRLIGWACVCGERLPPALCYTCGRVFERQGGELRQLAA
jgi:hypothetical protein